MRRLAARSLGITLALLLASLLLAACAPAAGSSASTAVPAGAGAIAAQAGQTIYVRVDYTLGAFGLEEGDLRSTMWVPSGYASEVGDVSAYFGLHDVQGATGWQIDLARMRLERTTEEVAATGSTSRTVDLWAEIRVQVPEDAIPGVYRVRGTIQARGGVTQPVNFRIDVRG